MNPAEFLFSAALGGLGEGISDRTRQLFSPNKNVVSTGGAIAAQQQFSASAQTRQEEFSRNKTREDIRLQTEARKELTDFNFQKELQGKMLDYVLGIKAMEHDYQLKSRLRALHEQTGKKDTSNFYGSVGKYSREFSNYMEPTFLYDIFDQIKKNHKFNEGGQIAPGTMGGASPYAPLR